MLRKALRELAGRGVKVLFAKGWPETPNGHHDLARRQVAFDRLLGELKGQAVLAPALAAGLDRLGIAGKRWRTGN